MTQQMPARIWVESDDEACGLWNKDETFGDVAFIRSDIAERMAAILLLVRSWADSRCPVREETPDPCPLCGATVDGKGLDGVCKSVEAIFPRDLLRDLDSALSAFRSATQDTENSR